jgi:hypothetical protein
MRRHISSECLCGVLPIGWKMRVQTLRRLRGTEDPTSRKLAFFPMEKEPAITLGSYYGAAILRAFWAGWDWAFGQGLGLTILLLFGAVASATLYAVARAWRRSQSWADARNSVEHIMADLLTSGIGAIVVVFIILFVWFFVKDAPMQMEEAHLKIEELQDKVAALLPPPPPPKPFYSQNDKNKLADMLTDLSSMLNDEALGVQTATQELLIQLRNEMMGKAGGYAPDGILLRSRFDALDKTEADLEKMLDIEHGPFTKYRAFSREFFEITQIATEPDKSNPFIDFRYSLGILKNALRLVDGTAQYNDKALNAIVVGNMIPAQNELMRAEGEFRAWVQETGTRITTFRNSLQP